MNVGLTQLHPLSGHRADRNSTESNLQGFPPTRGPIQIATRDEAFHISRAPSPMTDRWLFFPDPREDPKSRSLNWGSYKVPLVV